MKMLPIFLFSILILVITILLQPPHTSHGNPETQPPVSVADAIQPLVPSGSAETLRPWPSPSPQPTVTGITGSSPRVLHRFSFTPGQNRMAKDLHTPLIIKFETIPTEIAGGRLQNLDRVIQANSIIPPLLGHALEITPAVQGERVWQNERTLVFTPDPGWAPDTRYKVRLGDLGHTYFHTPPVVTDFSPARLRDVSRRTRIQFTFGVPVDRRSAERAFTVSPPVTGELRWSGQQQLLFEPVTPLDYATVYRVGFTGALCDDAGMPLPAPAGRTFTTTSALRDVEPQGRTDLGTPVRLRFHTAMDRASVEAALTLTPAITGSFTWQGEDKVTFAPDDFLTPNTVYTATLSASARAIDGQGALLEDEVWQFRTGDAPRTVDFGYGPNVQVLDAGDRRAVQLSVYGGWESPRSTETTQSAELTLQLYSLDVPQFLDRYSSSFRGIGPSEKQPIETGDLSPVHTWQATLAGVGEIHIPEDVPSGMYVLEARNGPGRDTLIVVLTHHALVVKQAEGQLVTWASAMAHHTPAAGMHLFFYDRDGTLVAEGATEERGLHRTMVPVDTTPLIVVGELDGDLTVSGLGQEWEAGDGWWGWWKMNPSTPEAKLYPYTDRPIYRPGQTVHARAIVRRDDDAVYRLPDEGEVVLRLRDVRDNIVAIRRRTPDEFGAVYADFEIADGGTVGTYHLEVSALGETTRQPFLVEAYRKPDYEVTLTPAQSHAVAGQPLTLTVQARYFFGAPVAGARVELVPYVAGDGYAYSGSSAAGQSGLAYGYAYEKLRRSGQTDAQGHWTVVLPASVTNGQNRQVWNLEATVVDASDLSVSGHAQVVVHRAAVGLSLHTPGHQFRPGDPIPITLLARDHAGAARGGVALNVGLYAWDREARAYQQAVIERQVRTGADGHATVDLQTTRSDWYLLRAQGNDAAGNDFDAQDWIWVWDTGSVWSRGDDGELRLGSDRDRYAPGDVAALWIESPVRGPALLSFERGTTRRETVIELVQGMNSLEFEILPTDTPNVHVAVATWQATLSDDHRAWQSRPDQELLTARTELLVPADHQRLSVSITPDRPAYAPRDEASLLVEIRDSAGRPVQAGFSLALVDEAIFALAADQTPDIFDAFYRPRPDVVRTYHSLRPVRWLDWGMGGGGGGGMLGGSPRSDFPDTAFWAPALTTGEDGQARVRVPLPDTLTSWRAVVRAVTPGTQVGQATTNVTVTRPLSVEPVLPRFLVQHDRATLTAVLHNHTGQPQTATVQLGMTGLELRKGASASQTLTLPANSTRAAGWPVVATRLDQATVRIDVAASGAGSSPWRDAVELSLAVTPRAVPEVETVAAQVEDEWITTVTLPDEAIPDISRWELALTPSIATGMLDGLEFLIDYPFG